MYAQHDISDMNSSYGSPTVVILAHNFNINNNLIERIVIAIIYLSTRMDYHFAENFMYII